MPLRSHLALVTAASFFLATTLPRTARAVEPVPYNSAQPVPYPQQAAPPPQATGAAGGDVILLKGGGMLRGTLLESIPNDHATIQLATGQLAIVPWERVERVERASKAAPAPRAAATAIVHVEADRPVQVERRTGPKTWEFVCNAPCDAELSLADEYRLTGSGMRASGAFHIAANPGERVTIDVDPAGKGGFVGGIVLASVGPVVALVGLVVLAAAGLECIGSSSSDHCNNDDTKNTGYGLILGGVVALTVGVVLIVSNARTKVAQEPAGTRAQPRDDAWLRLPTWHEDKTAQGLPRTADVPIFRTTF